MKTRTGPIRTRGWLRLVLEVLDDKWRTARAMAGSTISRFPPEVLARYKNRSTDGAATVLIARLLTGMHKKGTVERRKLDGVFQYRLAAK